MVLAVYYGSVADVVMKRADRSAGKVVVDVANPVNLETFGHSLAVPPDFAAAELAGQLCGARVVKAFNTTFAATLASGAVSGPTTVFMAGDDEDAKSRSPGIW